jgi:TusA-related sulfurtransferase
MDKINCFGDYCPVPLLKAINHVKDLPKGDSFMMVTDHSCVVESIQEYFTLRHYELLIDEVINGVWEITITKKN